MLDDGLVNTALPATFLLKSSALGLSTEQYVALPEMFHLLCLLNLK